MQLRSESRAKADDRWLATGLVETRYHVSHQCVWLGPGREMDVTIRTMTRLFISFCVSAISVSASYFHIVLCKQPNLENFKPSAEEHMHTMGVPQFAGYGLPSDVFPVHEGMDNLCSTVRKRLAGNVTRLCFFHIFFFVAAAAYKCFCSCHCLALFVGSCFDIYMNMFM